MVLIASSSLRLRPRSLRREYAFAATNHISSQSKRYVRMLSPRCILALYVSLLTLVLPSNPHVSPLSATKNLSLINNYIIMKFLLVLIASVLLPLSNGANVELKGGKNAQPECSDNGQLWKQLACCLALEMDTFASPSLSKLMSSPLAPIRGESI